MSRLQDALDAGYEPDGPPTPYRGPLSGPETTLGKARADADARKAQSMVNEQQRVARVKAEIHARWGRSDHFADGATEQR